MAELAAGVLRVVDDVLAQRGETGGPFFYAGDSVGGAVGLQLLLDRPARVAAAALLCTGAKIGDEAMWTGRIAQVSASGTPVMVSGSAERWFGPGFLERRPEVGSALLHALQEADDERLRPGVRAPSPPSTCATGSPRSAHRCWRSPAATTWPRRPDLLRAIADGVQDGRYVELDGVAHLAPAEAPERVAALLRRHFLGESRRRPATTAPCARSATPAWSYAARCSATRTSTGPPPAPPTSPATSRS